MLRVAILEDDADQAELLCLWLGDGGYSCQSFADAPSFQRQYHRQTYDLLIFDWELPQSSGIEVLRWVRANSDWKIPVLFVTRREREEDIVHALEQGADDFMTKPVSRAVTLARVRALARRSGVVKDDPEVIEHGDLKVDLQHATVFRAGAPLELTDREARLAVTLFSNTGRLLSRDYLLQSVWGLVPGIPTRTLDTHVSRLRQKLGLTPENGWQLKAVYQHGYRLEKLDPRQDAG
jgi:DNA-binding response OmpR family regulator